MNPLNHEQLVRLGAKLEAERKALETRLYGDGLAGHIAASRDSAGELSAIDNHPADIATELYEREKDMTLLIREELRLQRIEAALSAIGDGSYGCCARCGQPIPTERLDAVPETVVCAEHARQGANDGGYGEHSSIVRPAVHTSLEKLAAYEETNGKLGDDPFFEETEGAQEYVEPIESFLATDITGRHLQVVRNREYERYMQEGEGDRSLEY